MGNSMMEVVKIDKSTADTFVKNKHYSRRQGFFKEAFGLVEGGKIMGVCVYGIPPLQVVKHAFTDRDFEFYELVRLVVQSETPNATSFLVSTSLKMLSKQPCAVISYADTFWGHCGIIYQATNWYYIGATKSHDSLYVVDGERVHPRTLAARGIKSPAKWAKENNIERIPPKEKHRYVYFIGTKREKKSMKRKLKYEIKDEYPKCEQSRYDDGEFIDAPLLT